MKTKTNLEFISDDRRFGLKIERKHMLEILKICRVAGSREVGGIIIGIYDLDHKFAIAKIFSKAPLDSLQGETYFHRGVIGLQELLNQLWNDNRYFYLGEWHFHPNGSTDMSEVDIKQMQNISIKESYNCSEPILIILGGNPDKKWDMGVYVFPRNQRWVKLKNIDQQRFV
jgi:proteasome lid subunit RPN8/RPN11